MLVSNSKKRIEGDNAPVSMTPLDRRGGITGRHICTYFSNMPSRASVDLDRTKFFFRYWKEINGASKHLRIIAARSGKWFELPHPDN